MLRCVHYIIWDCYEAISLEQLYAALKHGRPGGALFCDNSLKEKWEGCKTALPKY